MAGYFTYGICNFFQRILLYPFPSAGVCRADGGRAGAGWSGVLGLVRQGRLTWASGLARTGRHVAPDWGWAEPSGRVGAWDWAGMYGLDGPAWGCRTGVGWPGWRVVGRGCAGIGFIHRRKISFAFEIKNH